MQALRSPSSVADLLALKSLQEHSDRRGTPLNLPHFPKLQRRGGANLPRVRGLRILPYMDDFLVLCRSRSEAIEARERVTQVLAALGLKRNENKGHWEVTQRLEHLGMLVDTRRGLFQVTPARLAKIKAVAKETLCDAKRHSRLHPARRLARFTGLAQCVYLAVPPARHYLRALHDCLSTKENWSSRVRLNRQALRDLQWWVDLPHRWNGRAIWRSPTTAVLHSDASMKGWGGVLNNTTPARGFWNARERRLHITELELEAVINLVRTFLPHLRSRHVFVHEDNQAVVHMLSHYSSRSPSIMRRLRHLFLLLDLNDTTLTVEYIRSEANVWADALSRVTDKEDWKLNPEVFQEIQDAYGPHTIDRF